MNAVEYKATAITLTKNIGGNENAYEATISVNDRFVVQVSGDDEIATFSGISDSSDKYHADPETQQNAYDNLDNDVVEKALEDWGFENNLGWLEENADVIL